MYSAETNSGNNVTAIGHLSAQTNTFDNVTALGYNSQPTKANQVMLGDTNVTEVFTYGKFVGSGASFSGEIEVGNEYNFLKYGNYGSLTNELCYVSQSTNHNFFDDNGDIGNVRAKYKSADGSVGISGTFGGLTYKDGILVNSAV